MKAMILAAGKGTRLLPNTAATPKALIAFGGRTLLEIVLGRLRQSGYDEIIINVHHLAGQIIDFLRAHEHFGMQISISDESDELLGTGGGIKKAAWYFGSEPFLVHNVDILSDIDLQAMRQFHQAHGGLATLAVRQRETSRYLLFTPHNRLNGWRDTSKGREVLLQSGVPNQPLAYSGIQIIDPALFRWFPPEKSFSIIDLYLRAAAEEPVLGYRHDQGLWIDAGKLQSLDEARRVADRI